MSEPTVVFEPVPSRYRVEHRIRDDKWVGDQCFPTLEEATAYAQKWQDNDLDAYAYRVVDTQPDADAERWFVEYQEDDGTWCGGGSFPSFEEAKNEACRISLFHTAWVTDTAVGTSSACVYLSDEDAPLTLDTYQQQAAKTAVYPTSKAFPYLIAGLAGEVGEVSSIFAKHWRDDGPLTRDNLEAELGDVLWFVAMLADEIGCDLSDVAQGNLNKLADRANRGKLKGNGDNR